MSADLTPKEEETAALVARGYTNKQIAGKLNISGSRVRILISAIAYKAGLDRFKEPRVQIAVFREFGLDALEKTDAPFDQPRAYRPTGVISPRTRFRILARDGFCCRYCGRKPPEVSLVVDHITPRAMGGGNDDSNLTAACRDCNAGKAAMPLPA